MLDFDGTTVLTDPWFRTPFGFLEAPGVRPEELPALDAILGSHAAFDHWDIAALRGHPGRPATQVMTATEGMARAARRAGFLHVERVRWGELRRVTDALTVEVLTAQRFAGIPSNNYVLDTPRMRVFFGGELHDLDPLRRYRDSAPPVDLALAPVNGMHFFGRRLVTTGPEAVAAAQILGAKVLVPIHDANRDLGLAGPSSSTAAAVGAADGVRVVPLSPGRAGTFDGEQGWVEA